MLKLSLTFYFIIFSQISFSVRVECKLEPLNPIESYTNSLIVSGNNPEQFQVFWKIIKDEIQFEMHCKTTGWVGLGISPNGGMVGSDMAIGWVTKGKAYLLDGYATGLSRPTIDKVQNFKLLEGAEINGYTILKFKRKLLTCDKLYDKEITTGTNYLIFAWNTRDPTKDGKEEFYYHGQNRYSNATVIINYREDSLQVADALPVDTLTLQILMQNILVPKKQTYHHCNLFEMPDMASPTHLIRVETYLKQNYNVQSIMLYECDDDYIPTFPLLNRECGPMGLPGDVAIKCESKLVFVWGYGGFERYDFPKNTGYKFNFLNKNKYLLLKAHYTNIYDETNLIDNSGLKLFFTKNLRKYDVGLIALGVDDSALSIQIPPGSKGMTVSSTCYPECTKKFLSDDGIYIFSGIADMNFAGTTVKTSVSRDEKIIKDLFDNENYDSNHHFQIDIQPTKVLKGDALITKCTYNTLSKGQFTYRGYSSLNDENCVNYVYYYPRIPGLQSCASNIQPKSVYDFYRSLMNENLIPQKPLDDKQYFQNINEIISFFKNEVTMSIKLKDRFMEFFSSKYNETLFCGNSNDLKNSIYMENISRYQPKELNEVKKCGSISILFQKCIVFQLLFIIITFVFTYA